MLRGNSKELLNMVGVSDLERTDDYNQLRDRR